MQVAFAILVQIRIDHALGNAAAEQSMQRALFAMAADIDDQRFAEEAIETFAAVGNAAAAKSVADRALASWPHSRRATSFGPYA